MEKKINIAELLKDCPKGMELDCTMFYDVKFNYIKEGTDFPIKCFIDENSPVSFNKYGEFNIHNKAKCVIFPKGKTTWEGFVPPCKFKDGDILYVKADSDWIFIYRKSEDTEYLYKYAAIRAYTNPSGISYLSICDSAPLCQKEDISEIRLATDEEKEKLFDAIKASGYKWNEETKTSEKLVEPKFKVGDRIKHKCEKFRGERTITSYGKSGYWTSINDWIDYENQDDWELVPNKFDINTLVPFESRVLVRNDESQYWIPAFWGYKRDDGYTTTFGWSKYCVPYEGNEHLLDKTDDCDEYYKTWK